MKLIITRILAFIIDYFVILLFAGFLFIISSLVMSAIELNGTSIYNPFKGQAIGLFSLTLPVFLYSVIAENSIWHATLGKKLLKLRVEGSIQNKFLSILKRNVLKYLPWEIAHTGIHWMFYYSSKNIETPIWVWILLILPQFIVFFYFLSLFFRAGAKTFYDRLANTKVLQHGQ